MALQSRRNELRAARERKFGFSMMEALIAFAITTLLIGMLARLFIWSTAQQETRLNQMLLAEFGNAVLEEYAVTYPLMPSEGQTDNGWQWRVSEIAVAPDRTVALSERLSYLRLTAAVWHARHPDRQLEVSTLKAIRTGP